MKTTYRIAIAELRSLFCSPVAWLILVIFAVQVGVAFGNAFDQATRNMGRGPGGPRGRYGQMGGTDRWGQDAGPPGILGSQ
mgnify:CR=1 FL=1